MTDGTDVNRRWEALRAKGRRRYIWLHGVLFWGGLTALIWSVGMCAIFEDWRFLPVFASALIGFGLGGYLWGAIMWRLLEKRGGGSSPAGDDSA